MHGERVVGYLLYSTLIDFTAYVNWMAIAKESQGQGIGAMLLSHLENHVRDNGISNIFLINQDHGFYEKSGYKKIAETQRNKIVGDINRSEWILTKNLYQ